jgi:hypothetical protein
MNSSLVRGWEGEITGIITKIPHLLPLGIICVGPSEKRRILWKYVRFVLLAEPDSAACKAVNNCRVIECCSVGDQIAAL